eukprot:CAMPEP_0197025154 /NCGR_PEP_ID=MMETSP1384-20130603/5567_1 /TAXON_ID=29189 /ORGANISM="Ammonia sp." /LENGTH=728 /DNA_ID=CAMNT_0042453647 /DNA_START=171 /DNA_END=2354 /DNA_ORIENTATION=+
MTKYEEHMALFNLNIPTLTLGHKAASFESVASDLSDHEVIPPSTDTPTSTTSNGSNSNLSLNGNGNGNGIPTFAPTFGSRARYQLPLSIITHCYLYYHRYQSYLLLLAGSEECKDVSYNQIQIINLRTTSDMKQNNEYPYTNFRLHPSLWRERVNYGKYFNKSVHKYLSQSKTVATPEPIMVSFDHDSSANKEKPVGIKVSSPSSPWSAMNSPYSPFAAIVPVGDDDDDEELKSNSKLTPIVAMQNLAAKPRSKSSGNLAKLQKIESKKTKNANKTNPPKLANGKIAANGKNAAKGKNGKASTASQSKGKSKKAVSMKVTASKRKSAAVLLPSIEEGKASKSSKKRGGGGSKKQSKKETASKLGKRRNTMGYAPGKGVLLDKTATTKKGKKGKNKVLETKDWDRYSYGECIVSISNKRNHNHDILPSWPWLKLKYKSDVKRERDDLEFCKFKMFVRCGGILTKDDEYTNENDLIFWNAANLNEIGRQIDAYHCKLPPFKQRMESPAVIYDDNNNVLAFGGYSYDDGKALKNIHCLNLNVKRTQFKWKKYGCSLSKARYESSVVHIVSSLGQNRFVIIGGKANSTKPIVDVEMFDSSKTTKESKCTTLAELNYARFRPGACIVGGDHSKLACCGGILYGKGTDRVEMYDVNKNKWTLHKTVLQYDHQHPSMWTEVKLINPNILYVAGNNISFGAKKGSLGYIEWTDLRENAKKFNLLYDEPLEELYEFW